MSKLAIKGLLAITTTLWLPAHADGTRAPWLPETGEESHNSADLDEVAESSRAPLPMGDKTRRSR